MRYNIRVKNVGRDWEFVRVYDGGFKRRAAFATVEAAGEACSIIEMMRSDSAFQGTEIVDNEPANDDPYGMIEERKRNP